MECFSRSGWPRSGGIWSKPDLSNPKRMTNEPFFARVYVATAVLASRAGPLVLLRVRGER